MKERDENPKSDPEENSVEAKEPHPLLKLLTRKFPENSTPKTPHKMDILKYELAKIRELEKKAGNKDNTVNTIKSLKKARKKKSNASNIKAGTQIRTNRDHCPIFGFSQSAT